MTENNKEMTAAQMLHEARTSGRRKRETSTIARQLCIREEYLVALENGDYHLIPEVVYVLGFARNYAMELGLDPEEIVGKIKQELGLECDCESELEDNKEPEEEPVHVAKPAEKKVKHKKNMFFEKTSKYIYKYWKWILSVIVGIIILVVGISFVFSLGNVADISNSEETVSALVKEPEYKQPVREKFGTENAATAKVIIQAAQESWVKIEDARGNTVFSRVLVPGDVYYVPDAEKYKGTFGNAGGVDVWVNGNLAPKLGAMHARKTGISMSPDSLLPADAPTAE